MKGKVDVLQSVKEAEMHDMTNLETVQEGFECEVKKTESEHKKYNQLVKKKLKKNLHAKPNAEMVLKCDECVFS